jgi:three-Cys-motif partner protein
MVAKSTKEHQFGGDWTTRKLEILARYLGDYRTALKNQKFKVAYIDAFAGTGYRTPQATDKSASSFLFADLAAAEPQSLLDGSARLALQVQPPFDRYVFIERDRDRCEGLESLRSTFPDLAPSIDIRPGDANQVIQEMCALDWRRHRAVLFLDPYGMEVEWETIEAIARTKAIDMWLLFSLEVLIKKNDCR